VTVTHGTNCLVASQQNALMEAVGKVMSSVGRRKMAPELWDGMTGNRIVKAILSDKHI